MEKRRNTRPGVLQWTPSPLRNSPSTALTSEGSWEDEDEEEDDFLQQMDEDGIIGLSEALESWQLGKPCGDSDPCSPEEVVPSGGVKDPAIKSSGEDHRAPAAPAENSDPNCLVSEPAVTASFLPHLYRFTEEKLAPAPRIDTETFPDMGFTETESYCSHTSVKSSLRRPETKLKGSPQPTAAFSEQVVLQEVPGEGSEKQKARDPPKDSPGSRQRSKGHYRNPGASGAKSNPAGMDEFRKASLSHQTPNFSKVEPRVHFPKHGYKPPKGKQPSLTRTSLSPEPPMVFKSPADIVQEVLFNNADGCSSDSNMATDVPNATVPPEFRCRQQATTLLQQLQEDYDRLLTKYAEAENTIDRLRLEAKVNLYSDPPQASHSVHSGLNRNALNLLKVDLSQAPRAEILSPGQSTQEKSDACSSPSQLGQQLSSILFSQSQKFLEQLETFEDLLQSDKLSSLEKIKQGLSQLSEGLNSLERGYLLARDEHKLLQQKGVETCHFDPERELEGLVFQCGLRMDELKEQVEQMQQEQLIYVSSSPPPNTSSSDVSEGGEIIQIHPQSPSEPFQIGPGVDVEVSSACTQSDGEDDGDEKPLNPQYFRPLICRDGCVEHEQNEPLDHQTLKEHFELPKAPSSLPLNTPPKHGETEEQKGWRNGNDEVQETFAEGKVESDQDCQRCSQTSLPSSSPSSTPPAPSARHRKRSGRRKSPSSSMSSLTDVASERRSSKVQAGIRRVLSQVRIISPETDSGFVGSESSHLIPPKGAALPHQRASESVSAPQDRKPDPPQSAALHSPLSNSDPPIRLDQEFTESPTLDSNQRRRSRQRRLSGSPRHLIGQKKQARSDDHRSSDLWSNLRSSTSNAHLASEDQRSNSFTQSVDSPLCSHSTSPPSAHHRHGDPLRAPNPSQESNHKDALIALQAEVDRLKEKLEIPRSAATAAASAQNSSSHLSTFSPHIRSREFWGDVGVGRRSAQAVDEIEQESVLSKTSRETSASAPKQQQQSRVSRRSEPDKRQPQVSRCTQTSHSISSVNERSRNTQTWRSSAPEAADAPDGKNQSLLCPKCSSILSRPSERPLGGNREPSDSPCSCCSICGHFTLHKCKDSVLFTDCYRCRPSTHLNHHPGDFSDRASTRRYTAAAVSPSPLQYVPWYPPQHLLSSTPQYSSPVNTVDSRSGTRRSTEKRGRRRRSQSVDEPRSLNGSLDRAIRAAQHMKHTSRHMARSLASGLLAQSCSY
ncbi:uncharacterized protein akna isoform 4-T7 [Anableps anableps]